MFRDPPQLCSPVDNRCDTFLRASRSCGSACTNARLSDSRIGVHGLSQVLSTVLMFFVRYSVQLICWHVYLQEFNHSPFPSCTAVALSQSQQEQSLTISMAAQTLCTAGNTVQTGPLWVFVKVKVMHVVQRWGAGNMAESGDRSLFMW